MRDSAIVLLLLIAIGCDRTDSEPAERGDPAAAAEAPEAEAPASAEEAGSTQVEKTKAPTDAPAQAKAPAPADAPAPDPGPVVLKMADGSGEPVRLGTLRDFHGLPRRLPGHTLEEQASGFLLRDGKSVVLEIHAPASNPSRVVATFRAPTIATGDGVTLGQTFSEVKDRVPGLKCQGEGGEDGTSVSCEAGENVTALFHLSAKYIELPDPMTLSQAEAAVGKKTVSELSWWSDAVPDPVSTTEPAARERHGALPAGVYWVDDGYSPCDLDLAPQLCIAPGAAVLAGTFADAKAAAKALEGVDAEALAPGYPLVVHTDQIHPQGEHTRGIAIVVALLAAEAEANDWAEQHAKLGKLEVVSLKGPRAIPKTRKKGDPAPQAVVRLRPGASRKKGECALEGGSFAVVAADEASDDVYEKVPARCEDGSATTIPWRDSLVEAVVFATSDGPKLLQLVGAECDAPQWRVWPLADGGAPTGKGTLIAERRC